MGYTHYWSHSKVDQKNFDALAKDVKAILKKTKVEVRFEYDDSSPPKVDDESIQFNGVGNEGHETFILTPKAVEFEFCKTARKPYDEVVTACLLAAADHIPDISIRSDGIWAEWEDGRALYEKVTKRKAKRPPEVEE